MDIDRENLLGQFLRARRELLRPEDIGIPAGPRRRVVGLRREEVAQLTGVSTDYYIRLEQGRERHPSAQVVDALARALELTAEAAGHLHRLARPPASRRRPPAQREHVSPHLLRLMAAWPHTPAVVVDRCLAVLATNALGAALFDGHTYREDLVRLVFLDPNARTFYPDWDRVAASTVGALHATVGADHNDHQLMELIGELSVKSASFRRLWARHDIRGKSHGTKRFHHPLAGELTLHYESLTVNSAPTQQLVVYQADPGSPSDEALSLLGSLTADATTHRPTPHPRPGAAPQASAGHPTPPHPRKP
ncbi:helix-turn-helix domain-containing protein [Streptomyces zagrosensis]|uniref:Transcriptional regulator with XRE-family HTH domain n=1 Tax=Streptomyces zagrosensis TaxID=1042984 RepID=A0A7W9QDV9_9ACTN|nr:helix-turn-helix transcriptional regulator [Streptomyces zagrosensis]MBB5938455.1 transcriptional regulator with XRE-family HTH domain [Streptomyces zagrosensis]